MSKLTELAYLQLSNNNFTGPIPLFHMSKNLTHLDLSYNNLNGAIPPTYFQDHPNLVDIKLHHNSFSGSIPSSLANTSFGVQALDLSSNHFEGPIPLSIFQLTALKILDLSNNHIRGVIPQWILNLTYLNLSQNYLTDWEEPLQSNTSFSVLDLHSNQLQRLLPVYPSQMTYLDFSNNNIQGSIPESICDALELAFLDLANNSLTGKIPKCLIAMDGSLSVLNLRGNKLIGGIDIFLSSCKLRTLNLNSNFLEGKLSKSLVNCTELEVLDLGNNQIDDTFPCWLKSISTLHVLILRSNKLHGSIECLTNQTVWPSIQIVDLASNNFSGKIPPAFLQTLKGIMADKNDITTRKLNDLHVVLNAYGNRLYYQNRVTVMGKGQRLDLVKILTVFTSVDLSCNKFEGTIPEELGQLKALYILNLSQNAFGGHIPSSIGNLKHLESLDLSNNSLSGEIPTQLASLSFLSVLNLSFNLLVGRIPTGTQLQSFEASSFIGNEGLCGPPLTQNCSGSGASGRSHPDTESLIDWNFISAELGFTFGIGIVILSLVLWKPWRLWYCKHLDDLLYRIFPQLDFVYQHRGGKTYRTLKWKPH